MKTLIYLITAVWVGKECTHVNSASMANAEVEQCPLLFAGDCLTNGGWTVLRSYFLRPGRVFSVKYAVGSFCLASELFELLDVRCRPRENDCMIKGTSRIVVKLPRRAGGAQLTATKSVLHWQALASSIFQCACERKRGTRMTKVP